jgi:hypothetical protein
LKNAIQNRRVQLNYNTKKIELRINWICLTRLDSRLR